MALFKALGVRLAHLKLNQPCLVAWRHQSSEPIRIIRWGHLLAWALCSPGSTCQCPLHAMDPQVVPAGDGASGGEGGQTGAQ